MLRNFSLSSICTRYYPVSTECNFSWYFMKKIHVKKIYCLCQQIVINDLTREYVTLKYIEAVEYLAVHFILYSHSAGLWRMLHRKIQRQIFW